MRVDVVVVGEAPELVREVVLVAGLEAGFPKVQQTPRQLLHHRTLAGRQRFK